MEKKTKPKTITVGALNEAVGVEYRVAITPESASRLLKFGVQAYVEPSAGLKAGWTDADYEKAGAVLAPREDILKKSSAIAYIAAPTSETIYSQSKGSYAVGMFNSLANKTISDQFASAGVIAFDIYLLPRKLSKTQSMDAMTSQAAVAGYKAVILAANEFCSFLPMMTTAAGTIKPASVLILGAGIAGLQAIGTARRLGAVVTAYDVRPAAKEEVLSLGAKFLDLAAYGGPDLSEGQGAGGYARELTPEEKTAQQAAVDKAAANFDIIIATAQVPGRRPPVLLTKQGLDGLKRGSVVVDVAASALGGNIEGSLADTTIPLPSGVKIVGAGNLAADIPRAASNLLSRNISDVLLHFVSESGQIEFKADDELAGLAIGAVSNNE
ncbi:MAG: NAD(P) transhydrogenase subunit alpha [Elusimicrobiota bacterium]|jgi:NAD(P) transhydrogenase subunit alpha|nr:NAD(P) transhydrogenase subunit alpha [Elusimicrobiota bacterium]